MLIESVQKDLQVCLPGIRQFAYVALFTVTASFYTNIFTSLIYLQSAVQEKVRYVLFTLILFSWGLMAAQSNSYITKGMLLMMGNHFRNTMRPGAGSPVRRHATPSGVVSRGGHRIRSFLEKRRCAQLQDSRCS